VIVFATTATWLVEHHRDIHGERKPMRHQIWRILAAALIGLTVVAFGFAPLGGR
jgi:hypothetical protein